VSAPGRRRPSGLLEPAGELRGRRPGYDVLALLELPRGLTPAELAGGFALPDALPLAGRIGESFRRRLDALPTDTRELLLVALEAGPLDTLSAAEVEHLRGLIALLGRLNGGGHDQLGPVERRQRPHRPPP
jgi:hypothetical protein